jgi:TonB family protein
VPPQPKPLPVVPPTPEPVVKEPVKEIVKTSPVMKKKKIENKKSVYVAKEEPEENNITKPKPKEEKKLAKKEVKKKVEKKKIRKKRIVKKRKSRRKRSNNPLANALMGSGASMYPSQSNPASSGSNVAKMIKQLYGREFDGYSPTQKKFIRHNLGNIHRITQQTLWRNGYPETARRTRQQGTNVVSFYLHPNGDISGLKLKKHIGYASLDQNTLEVIRIAYKDYPLPNQKTKIVFYVQYSIY